LERLGPVLFEPDRTQFDLSWRMFGVSVRVHPLFWLVSAILGFDSVRRGFEYLLLWIGCVFVSILIHEFGHVFMGQVFGSRGHIVLYSMGGLAIGSSDLRSRWQRIAVSFAGPLAQFLLFGLIFLAALRVLPALGPARQLSPTAFVIEQMLWINLAWPILNLLPIWPLDGGRISRDLLDWLMPRQGVRVSLGISFLVAGVLAVNALAAANGHALVDFLPGGTYMALFFALFALSSFQEMQQESEKPWRRQDPWD
jgi:Zn-dependent protease